MRRLMMWLVVGMVIGGAAVDASAADELRVRVVGLFGPERARDFREVCRAIAGLEIVGIDVAAAEAVLRPAISGVAADATEEQRVAAVDAAVRDASRHTFGLRAPDAVPREQRQFVVIDVHGLDCRACCLAAYEAVMRLDGVVQATTSFRAGRVCAWIDPQRVDRSKLVAALRERGVTIDEVVE